MSNRYSLRTTPTDGTDLQIAVLSATLLRQVPMCQVSSKCQVTSTVTFPVTSTSLVSCHLSDHHRVESLSHPKASTPPGAPLLAQKLNSKIGDNLPSDMAVPRFLWQRVFLRPAGRHFGHITFFFDKSGVALLASPNNSPQVPQISHSPHHRRASASFSSYSPTLSRFITLEYRIVQAPILPNFPRVKGNKKKKRLYPTEHLHPRYQVRTSSISLFHQSNFCHKSSLRPSWHEDQQPRQYCQVPDIQCSNVQP